MLGRRVLPLAALLAVAPATSLAAAFGAWQDRDLRIIQTTEANFPAALSSQGVREGEVRAVIHVDASGRLVDVLITAHTHPEFATELLGNLRQWEFEPPIERGEPLGTRRDIVFRFAGRGMVVSLTSMDTVTSNLGGLIKTPMISLVARLPELDQPPQLVHVVHPPHPGRWIRDLQGRGRATVDFYIDADGRPRMPVATRASHEAFAAAAIDAVQQWRFAPPTSHGRPVAVRVVQEIVFPERT